MAPIAEPTLQSKGHMNATQISPGTVLRSFLLILIAAPQFILSVARADDTPSDRTQSLLIAGYGVAGILNAQKASGALLEWRSPQFWHALRGWSALNVATQGAYFAGAGLYYGFPLGRRWEIGVSSGPGFFRPDRRLKLGDSIEFRSLIECSYRFGSGQRVALRFGHVSNAGFGRVNPGSEFLQVAYELPFNQLQARIRALD